MRLTTRYSLALCICVTMAVTLIWQSNRHIATTRRMASGRRLFGSVAPRKDANRPQLDKTRSRDVMRGRYDPSLQRRGSNTSMYHPQYTHPVPLDSILNNNTIVGDPGWLLDFGILGFGKCGTSTMMIWLLEHPEIQAFGKEMGDLMKQRPDQMIQKLYEDLEPGPYKRGYKAPQDIAQRHVLDYFRQYWPHAKLILGIRHPVRWFESLYNFRIQNVRHGFVMPHANELNGACIKGLQTCTNKGNFAVSLMNLGKQNYRYPRRRKETRLERKILALYGRRRWKTSSIPYMENPVFLFELNQLGDANATRSEQFRYDVSSFLGLQEPLPAIPRAIPGKHRSEGEQKRRDEKKIDICDDEFIPVRASLMEISAQNSLWIRQVFLKSPTVNSSSPDYLNELLMSWMVDPCDEIDTRKSKPIDEA